MLKLNYTITVTVDMASKETRSSVWKYFSYQEENNTSVCQIKAGEVQCGKVLQGKFATNLKKHLKNKHKEEFDECEAQEKERGESRRKKTAPNRGQTTLSTVPPYKKESTRYTTLTQKLAVFIGASNVAFSLVENEEFRDLLHELDPRYKVPNRKAICQEIDKVYQQLKERIKSVLDDSSSISLCADIWSKPGMTASFLGITAHCFTLNTDNRHTLCIGLKRFPSPHTGARIAELLQTVVDQWCIDSSKLFRVLTDNGSNMVAAFNIIDEDTDTSENDIDCTEIEAQDNTSEIEDNPIIVEGESEDLFEEQPEDDLDKMERTAGLEIANFETCEEDHHRQITGIKRKSCFIHTLQLVVKVFETAPSFKATLKTALTIVKKVNKSCRASERLVQLAGKKLTKNCPTRWDSLFLVICRLLEVKQHLNTVLEELQWDGLTATNWKNLASIEGLLKPFAHHTNITSSEKTTTIAMVIPVLKELELHLKVS